MRMIVIGAVAAGTSAAAKARRSNRDAQIVIYEKDSYISYSACGMPYYLGGEIKDPVDLAPRDPAYFKSAYDVDILTRHEVTAIDREQKTVTVKNLSTGEVFTDPYDKLVIATGARVKTPALKGADKSHVFTFRNINDMNSIDAFIDAKKPRTAAIIGAGYVGLESCESFARRGISVSIIARRQIMPEMDSDIAVHVHEYLQKQGVNVHVGVAPAEITDSGVILADGSEVEADMVLLSTGVTPNVELARDAGLVIGETGAIAVTPKMQTSDPDIYSCGDCAEQFHVVTGKPVYRPMGSTANKTGRIAGDTVMGGDFEFKGVLGTGILRIFDMAVAQTGLSEREARALGYEVVTCLAAEEDKPGYMQGTEMFIKAVADVKTGRVLGAQIVGFEGVDKRIDVFVTAITFKATVDDLVHLDLAYAPPFSTSKDPVMYIGMILESALRRARR